MQLSMRTDYALRTLVCLIHHNNSVSKFVSISEIARQNDIPKRFLEQIILALKKKGWVISQSGKYGGYRINKNPSSITMGEVIRYFDGYLAPLHCVSITDYKPCSQEKSCCFRRVMLVVRNIVADLMDKTTLADITNMKPVELSEVMLLINNIEGENGDGI